LNIERPTPNFQLQTGRDKDVQSSTLDVQSSSFISLLSLLYPVQIVFAFDPLPPETLAPAIVASAAPWQGRDGEEQTDRRGSSHLRKKSAQ
jgi:hypothetical protein